jgi:hypothetical protein
MQKKQSPSEDEDVDWEYVNYIKTRKRQLADRLKKKIEKKGLEYVLAEIVMGRESDDEN